ncbi:unnamed protein product [Colias eurytheme]|nr:unnamed protein product [Colias eurytheme]
MFVWALLFSLNFISAYKPSSITRCLWHNNTCTDRCPDHMIIKHSNCNQTYWYSQRTCEHPEPTLVGAVCGFARCDCPEETVLDEETGYCYDVDNCPTKHHL